MTPSPASVPDTDTADPPRPAASGKPGAGARRARARWRAVLCVAPLLVYLGIFLIVPVAKLLGASFMPHGEFGFENYLRIATVPVYAKVLGITFKIALWTTVFAVVGGYPLAYYVTIVSPRARDSLLFWIALPFWTSFLVRTFAWIVLLGRHGVLNQLFDAMGLAGAPYRLLYTFGSVLVGMGHALMPLAILTMMSVMRNIDRRLVLAASTLGASRARAFLTVYLPLSAPGIAAASILVFVTSLGFFVTPALMGSRHDVMLTQLVIDQVLQTLNWSFAGALSLVLLVAVLLLFLVYDRVIGLQTLAGGASSQAAPGSRGGLARRAAYGLLHALADALDRLGNVARARRRPPRAVARRSRKVPLAGIYAVCLLAFLLGPTLLMIPESFTAVSSIDWPPRGFSPKWYLAIGQSPTWLTALTRSLVIGVFAAAGSMLLGVPTAFFLSRTRSRWRTPLFVFSLLPLIVPHIIYAVGLFYFLSSLGLVGTLLGMIIGHTAITVPYVVVTVLAILKHYDRHLDAAAHSMGATAWQTLTRVTFPVLAAGMVSAFLFSFVTSFDELTIALFMTSGLTSTLPKLFYDEVSLSISPVIAAVSTCLLLLSVVVIVLSNRLKARAVSGAGRHAAAMARLGRRYANVADYRAAARRRLPRIAFDYLDRGAEDGRTLARNVAAFADIRFAPRAMVDVSTVRATRRLSHFAARAPIVVGPTGLNGLFWPRADELLAKAAADAGLPFALSSASTSLLEDVRAAAPEGELWLQVYINRDRRIAEHMMARAAEAGYSTLLVTVDTPVHGKRDHDVHNGYRLPLPVTPKLVLDLLRHPHWALQIARHGGPRLTNIARSLGQTPDLEKAASALARQMDPTLTWPDLGWLRRRWSGPILVKGIHTVADARLAHRHGADGVVLSNHGGRQLEGALAGVEMLPPVVEALGERLAVYVDGGARRGADVFKAVGLGARGVLLGRAPLYGLAAHGAPGVAHVLSLLYDEIITTLTLLGCGNLDSVPSRVLAPAPASWRVSSPSPAMQSPS